jgi:hypothetical protein
MCFLARMFNCHTHFFMLLALSCVIAATGVRSSCRSLGIVYQRDKIEALLMQIGEELSLWPTTDTPKSTGFCVSDNCAYRSKIVLQHAERDGGFIQTANYL